ncbi:MAG: glycosyltransferase family 9 protein [Candidatus Krumholzibacteriia bacterium]
MTDVAADRREGAGDPRDPARKVLVARTDRLGDLVLSLPVFAYIKERRPRWEVHALVAREAVPLVENDPHVDAIWSEGHRSGDLERRLAAERFDAAVLLLYRRELAQVLRRAGVRRRIGPLSKWSSWWLLNGGVWQARSRTGRHEWAYNLQLAEKLAGRGGPWPEPRLHLSGAQEEIGRSFRAEFGLGRAPLVFVHPGSGGSALDWEPERFAAVVRLLTEAPPGEGVRTPRVFVTGGPQDHQALAQIAPLLPAGVVSLGGRYRLREFLGVLAAGDLMIAPSTGPLHMASALGLSTLGLFAPAPTMSPDRWGNRGELARSLVPPVDCPSRRNCLGEECLMFDCMTGIGVDAVVNAARELLVERERRSASGP